jgi:hypothetical protein
MMPLVETAASTPAAPAGAKPSAAVKLDVCRPANASAAIVSSGTPTFHQVAVLLVLASRRMLRKLSAVNAAISTTAATIPLAVRTFWPSLTFIHPSANE